MNLLLTISHIWIAAVIVVQWTDKASSESDSTDQSLDDCLHRYLEKDFGSFEAAIGLPDMTSSHHMDISEISVRKECLNWMSMLTCYDKVSDRKDEKLYEKLITGLVEMKIWICDGGIEEYKDFLGGIQCAIKLANNRFCNQHTGMVKNKWQKLLRLELGTEICHQIVSEHRCFMETMSKYCNRGDMRGYNKTMTIVVDNWCNFGAKTTQNPSKVTTFIIGFIVSFAFFFRIY